MSYRDWLKWMKGLEWPLKWFVIIILIRPLVDNFYYLKEISPLLSPLYIIGVATPFLATYAILKIPKPNYSRLDTLFHIFSVMIVIPCIALLISDNLSLDSLDFTFKFIFIPCVYFFCRRLIKSKVDLHGLLQAFLYSSIIIILVFSYELIFNPISIQISRGFERYHGNFADIMNYSIYMTVSLLILGYAVMERSPGIPARRNISLFLFAIFFSFLMLINIHHTASYVVVGAILLLFVAFILRANITTGIGVLMIFGIVIFFTGTETLSEKFLPLIETDILVYEGEIGDEALMHGRMGRWMRFFDHFNDQNLFIQLFGLPYGMDNPYIYIGNGSHNDYVRTLMFNGYVGLIFYMFLLLNFYIRIMKFKVSIHFLGIGILTIVGLYSISTTPTLYPSLLYIVIPVIAITALPKKLFDGPNE